MNQEQIGKFIAELRKEKNMTQQELADKIAQSAGAQCCSDQRRKS